MEKAQGKKGQTKRSTSRRRRVNGLKKHQQVDGVIVEETFPLYSQSNAEVAVGDGIYVSATTSNSKRYYGVLIDQPALKVASELYFEDQSNSLQLNERMKLLLEQRQQQQKQQIKEEKEKDTDTATNETNTKAPSQSSEDDLTLPASDVGISTPVQNMPAISDTKHDGQDQDYDVSLSSKRPLVGTTTEPNDALDTSKPTKKARLSNEIAPDTPISSSTDFLNNEALAKKEYKIEERPVQKLKYVKETPNNTNGKILTKDKVPSGYRILVATFCSIDEAACGDNEKAKAILQACEEGGNFLMGKYNDSYYYQYEVLPSSLNTGHNGLSSQNDLMRISMGFNTFLHDTLLPSWFPLSNLHSQHKVLTMLNMKRDNQGKIKWEGSQQNENANDVLVIDGGTKIPMQPRPRKQYQIGVIGGGIAGLACCQELVTLLHNDGIDAQVTLIEARSRLGGRLQTDYSWKTEDNQIFTLELGASWIHGINDNPLAALAKGAGAQFVTASEDVKMLEKDMKEVDGDMDERMGKLFDDLLDHAADDCWISSESPVPYSISEQGEDLDPQAAVRWYASTFASNENGLNSQETYFPKAVRPPSHRRSNDRSVDYEIGKAIAKYRIRDFAKLSSEEHRMLLWNIKNTEYAIGANLDMMSTKYWDVDDRHAFEGDHVLLREGYSMVIDYMLKNLKSVGPDRFQCLLNFPVGKVDYGRKSATQQFGRDRFGRHRQLSEISDTCSVTSEDGKATKFFDFLVCAVPLGVLKESVENVKRNSDQKSLLFQPCLPFTKIDAISNVGFGLLNKVYIRFPNAFWRSPGFFKNEDNCLFGNVSGVNPHHYMFFDIGRRLATGDNAPAVLMSLVSGKEAVALEYMSDEQIVDEVMETLRAIFSKKISLPQPIAFKITRWGTDRFSRGSYTYLPPGSTDQDFQLLQSPINSNGDSLLLEGAEVMRLFFAGEHTTALHPSVAHGAMLSGMRAAREVVSTIQSKNIDDKDTDKVIPVAIFRHRNPTTPLQCNLCHKGGGQVREGALLAFKRGARQVLVHNNCAEYSPEVEVANSKWKNVIRAVNRGKSFTCAQCSMTGATIGCSAENCFRIFHFSCAEDCGWRFDRDGKSFYCDLHRIPSLECDRISLHHYVAKNKGKEVFCCLCQMMDNEVCGELLAFQKGRKQLCLHLNCIKYTNIVDVSENKDSRMGHEYYNVFGALEKSRDCSSCKIHGASILCTFSNCDEIMHFPCAVKSGWNFDRKGGNFRCSHHRNKRVEQSLQDNSVKTSQLENGGMSLNHNLLSQFGAAMKGPRYDIPGNLDIGGTLPLNTNESSPEKIRHEDETDSDDSFPGENKKGFEVMDIPLSSDVTGSKQLVRLERISREEPWDLSLKFVKNDGFNMVAVAAVPTSSSDLFSLREGDILVSINGSKIGSNGLKTLRDILFRLKQEVDLMLQVTR